VSTTKTSAQTPKTQQFPILLCEEQLLKVAQQLVLIKSQNVQ